MEPEPPIKPSESDCCNSSCHPCILDVYEQQLKRFNASLKTFPKKPQTNCLSLTSYSVFKLVNIKQHTKNCNMYTFQYVKHQNAVNNQQSNTFVSVLYEPGQFFLLKGNVHGETFQKAYTPIYIENEEPNCFTVLVKLYENGRMSRLFQRSTLGTETLWRGPYGDFRVNYQHKNVLFIAQGTGLTPFYSILCDMLNNEDCYTFLNLLYCCNVDDVVLREELYKLGEFWNFKYELFVSGGARETFIKKYNEVVHFTRLGIDKIRTFLESVKNDIKILVCGAESFCENIRNMLVQCDMPSDDIIIF